ncbi:MAG: hypothetical protein K0Q60_2949 [Microvirga sp.]|jgi:hypothetical protein|nr:hypothetical protein [Microvirga sp.]
MDASADCAFETWEGHSVDLLADAPELDLVATDPPYAFGGSGDEHAISATVAVALRAASGGALRAALAHPPLRLRDWHTPRQALPRWGFRP